MSPVRSARATWDLAVVGAGIVGAWTAWLAHCANPQQRILLLDRGPAGGGATRWSAGLDFPYGHNPLRRSLTGESRIAWDELRARLPDLPVRDLRLTCVLSQDRLATETERFVGGRLPRPASPPELRRELAAWPELRLADDAVVLAGGSCQCGDAAGVTVRLVEELAAAGVGCWEGVPVTRVEAAGDRLSLVIGDAGALLARRVVVATGPWVLRGPGAAAKDEVRVKKVVALHLDVRPRPHQPVLFFLDDDAFLMPLPERGQILFSFTLERWDLDPDQPAVLTERDRAEGLDVLRRHCPSLADATAGGRAFYDAYGPERSPLVRTDPQLPGMVLAGAGSGSGFRLAPALARRALALLDAGPPGPEAPVPATAGKEGS